MTLRAEGMGRARASVGGVISGVVEPVGALLTILAAGLVVGGLEVGAIALLAFQANAGQFQDLAFGFLIATVLLWLLVLFSGRRVNSGMNMSSTNSTAQSAFAAQVAFEESKLLRKVPPMRGRLLGSLSVLMAAVVVLIAFLVSAFLA